ncbi:unnamed protein product [Closterium sp. NIES-65]|nr:unnamed protein product [Closterium sp. NIES-65]
MAPSRIRPALGVALLALCAALSALSAQAKGSHPKGSCTPVKSNVTIPIKTAADFQKRKQQGRNQTVVLMLQNSLLLSQGSGLLFDADFSCTILTAAKPNLYIKYNDDDMPTLRIWNTSNVLVYGINFLVAVTTGSPQCPNVPEVGTGVNCPAVHISRSYGVIFGKSTVFGRVDVHRSMNSRVDSIKVTGTPTFASSHGVIRVAYSGHSTKLIKANIAISNNEAYGVDTPIVLYRGAVGVKVFRNYVHDFIFAGIRCGADVHFSGDCMMTNVSNNLVVAKGRNTNGDHDAAGIYYCTHWFNPGNVAQCNYVFNGDHCYYLDYDTSDVRIRGGACINTYDGIKVNNGKRNVIKDVVMKGQIGAVGWCTCLTPTVNNCLKDPGLYWENMRKAYYDTPAFRKESAPAWNANHSQTPPFISSFPSSFPSRSPPRPTSSGSDERVSGESILAVVEERVSGERILAVVEERVSGERILAVVEERVTGRGGRTVCQESAVNAVNGLNCHLILFPLPPLLSLFLPPSPVLAVVEERVSGERSQWA